MKFQAYSLQTHFATSSPLSPISLPRSSHLFSSPVNLNPFCTSKSTPGFHLLKRDFKLSTSYTVKSSSSSGVVRCEMQSADSCSGVPDDGFYMRKAVELARTAIGCTSPNPLVGCVVVKEGKVVGEGFHPKAGQPHAEVYALRDAGDLAENATAYVTLEPCNHYGRTPPCTEALIKAKVKRVVVGMVDPNPIVASNGVARLRDAGIEVTVSVEEEFCKKLNEPYIHRMLTGKPFVTLRYTLSLNGYFLDQLGQGAADCGGYFSQLLQEYDAIISSPSLLSVTSSFPTSQEPKANQPLQILIAKDPTSKLEVPIFAAKECPKVIIFTDKETTEGSEIAHTGVETVVLDRMDLDLILEYCKQQGLCSVLIDLRGSLSDYEDILSDCLEKHLLQKVVIEVLPVWSGSKQVPPLPVGLDGGDQKVKLKSLSSRMSGESTLLEAYI